MKEVSSVSDKYKILAVDDEPIVHQMLTQIIGESNLSVELAATALSASEALALTEHLHPDICLFDIEMGDTNGLELASRMEEKLGYKPFIIYLSAHDRFEYAQKAITVGAVEYLLKPIRQADLVAALGRVVDRMQAERLERIEQQRIRERLKQLLPGAVSSVDIPRETHRASLARSARRFIDQHYPERISVATVADHVHLSPGYLGCIFKAEFSLSIRAYLRSVRISRAKELMQDHTLNLTEIAQVVGYDDINYFSQAFFEETGIRPSEYRGAGRRWSR